MTAKWRMRMRRTLDLRLFTQCLRRMRATFPGCWPRWKAFAPAFARGACAACRCAAHGRGHPSTREVSDATTARLSWWVKPMKRRTNNLLVSVIAKAVGLTCANSVRTRRWGRYGGVRTRAWNLNVLAACPQALFMNKRDVINDQWCFAFFRLMTQRLLIASLELRVQMSFSAFFHTIRGHGRRTGIDRSDSRKAPQKVNQDESSCPEHVGWPRCMADSLNHMVLLPKTPKHQTFEESWDGILASSFTGLHNFTDLHAHSWSLVYFFGCIPSDFRDFSNFHPHLGHKQMPKARPKFLRQLPETETQLLRDPDASSARWWRWWRVRPSWRGAS